MSQTRRVKRSVRRDLRPVTGDSCPGADDQLLTPRVQEVYTRGLMGVVWCSLGLFYVRGLTGDLADPYRGVLKRDPCGCSGSCPPPFTSRVLFGPGPLLYLLFPSVCSKGSRSLPVVTEGSRWCSVGGEPSSPDPREPSSWDMPVANSPIFIRSYFTILYYYYQGRDRVTSWDLSFPDPGCRRRQFHGRRYTGVPDRAGTEGGK